MKAWYKCSVSLRYNWFVFGNEVFPIRYPLNFFIPTSVSGVHSIAVWEGPVNSWIVDSQLATIDGKILRNMSPQLHLDYVGTCSYWVWLVRILVRLLTHSRQDLTILLKPSHKIQFFNWLLTTTDLNPLNIIVSTFKRRDWMILDPVILLDTKNSALDNIFHLLITRLIVPFKLEYCFTSQTFHVNLFIQLERDWPTFIERHLVGVLPCCFSYLTYFRSVYLKQVTTA